METADEELIVCNDEDNISLDGLRICRVESPSVISFQLLATNDGQINKELAVTFEVICALD